MGHPYIQFHNYVFTWAWMWNSAELLSKMCRITNMTWLNSYVCWRMWFIEGVWYDYSWCYNSGLVTCLQSSNLVILKLHYISRVLSFTLKFLYINLLIVFGVSQNIKHHGVYYLWSFSRCLNIKVFIIFGH